MESLNIDRVGPGAWYIIHLMAANSKNEKQIDAFHELVNILCERFFCLRCRDHFCTNIRKFPPPKVNSYNELFIWSVEMHNRVNILNNKPLIGYREALDYYIGPNAVCSGDCGSKKPTSLITSDLLMSVLSTGEKVKFNNNSSKKL